MHFWHKTLGFNGLNINFVWQVVVQCQRVFSYCKNNDTFNYFFSLQLSLTADLISEEIFKLIARKDNEPKKKKLKVKRLVALRLCCSHTLKESGKGFSQN